MKKFFALLLCFALILPFAPPAKAEPALLESSNTVSEPYYGSRPYQPTTRTDVSDMGYALEIADDIDYYSADIDPNQMGGMQIEDIQDYLRECLTLWMNLEIGYNDWDEIDNYDSSIGTNYFRVFCQIGFINAPDSEEDDTTYDYGDMFVWRWMYQTSDGTWAYKADIRSSYYHVTSNLGPASIPWEFDETPLESNSACLYFQVQDTQNTDCDTWFLDAVRDYTLMYIGYNVGDPKMPPILDAVDTALETNAGMAGDGHTSLTKNELIQHLTSTKIFSCITHGSQTFISASDGSLTISDINALSNSAFDDLEFVYFGACSTGHGYMGADNLVHAVYNKGADVVLGFTRLMPVDETNFWTREFMLALSTGVTLAEAMAAADSAVANNDEFQEESDMDDTYATSGVFRLLRGSDQTVPCG